MLFSARKSPKNATVLSVLLKVYKKGVLTLQTAICKFVYFYIRNAVKYRYEKIYYGTRSGHDQLEMYSF